MSDRVDLDEIQRVLDAASPPGANVLIPTPADEALAEEAPRWLRALVVAVRQLRADAVRADTRHRDMLTSQQGRRAREVWAAYHEGWTHCRQSRHKGPKGWDHSDAKRRLTQEEP